MGMKKSNAFMMMSLAMMMSEGVGYPDITNDKYLGRTPTKEELEERAKRIKEQKENDRVKKLLSNNGVNEYFYGQNVIYARNKKNADRKARNKGYL